MRMASQEKAEADKILVVKAAEADAESKELSGQVRPMAYSCALACCSARAAAVSLTRRTFAAAVSYNVMAGCDRRALRGSGRPSSTG